MRPIVVVETFPCGQLLLQINIVAIVDQLVESILVGSVGPLDFAVELRRSRLDVDMFHAEVSDVPVKERLELVAAVSSNGADPVTGESASSPPWTGLGQACIAYPYGWCTHL